MRPNPTLARCLPCRWAWPTRDGLSAGDAGGQDHLRPLNAIHRYKVRRTDAEQRAVFSNDGEGQQARTTRVARRRPAPPNRNAAHTPQCECATVRSANNVREYAKGRCQRGGRDSPRGQRCSRGVARSDRRNTRQRRHPQPGSCIRQCMIRRSRRPNAPRPRSSATPGKSPHSAIRTCCKIRILLASSPSRTGFQVIIPRATSSVSRSSPVGAVPAPRAKTSKREREQRRAYSPRMFLAPMANSP